MLGVHSGRVRQMILFNQDEVARSAGEGGKTSRERKKLDRVTLGLGKMA